MTITQWIYFYATELQACLPHLPADEAARLATAASSLDASCNPEAAAREAARGMSPRPREDWMHSFIARMAELGVSASPAALIYMASELWQVQGHLNPVDVADNGCLTESCVA